MSNPALSFRASVVLVLEEIKHIKVLRRSTAKQREFALHVCLVAHGVRTGYLVDSICPPNPADTFDTLLLALRKKSIVFKDVVFWHHTPTAQSFLVHVPLLQDKITALLGGAAKQQCVFVKLKKYPSVSNDPPDVLREALGGLRSAMAESPDARLFPLSELFAQDVLIPLAAVLIDYPVAYFPPCLTQTSFLQGEPLDIYTVSFKWATGTSDDTLGGEHVLLKFSCPEVLVSDDTELSPCRMIAKLRSKFAPVLERIGAFVVVTHSTETQERVAL